MGITGHGNDASRARSDVRRAVLLVRAACTAIETLDPADAVLLAGDLAGLEKVARAGALRCARSVGDLGARRHSGEVSAAAMLSTLSGTSVGKAKAAITAVEQAHSCPVLGAAFDAGDLSIDQAALIARVAAGDPEVVGRLVSSAKEKSLRELRLDVERVRREQRDEAAVVGDERRLHARRYCRTWVPEGGGLRIDALVGTEDGASFLAALDREQARLVRASGRAGDTSSHDQLRADALVALARRDAGPGAGDPVRPELLLRVDAAALVRGQAAAGELCEIAGIGPVSVRTARSVLGEALWTLLVTDGDDIRTVTSTTRAVPKKVENALALRDPMCVVPGCGASERLEIDHWAIDFAWRGPTALENLCRLCAAHHRMKTRTGWRLIGGPGRWRWLPPKPLAELARARSAPARRRPGSPRAPDTSRTPRSSSVRCGEASGVLDSAPFSLGPWER